MTATAQNIKTALQEPIKAQLLSRLRELGLSGYAAKAYLTLLVEPDLSAGGICKETGTPDSKIYYALEELVRRHLVLVQRGNPSLYRPVDAKQAMESLKQEAEQAFNQNLRGIETLAREIEPLLSSQAEEQEIELAYIVKGKRNILAHMIRTIEAAKEEVLVMNSGESLLEGLLPALQGARERGLRVKVAVYGDPGEVRKLRFSELKQSKCDCNVLITDSRRLVTISRPEAENGYAIITEDPNMISLSRSYYDNPTCCSLLQIRSSRLSKA